VRSALRFRREHATLFREGSYVPLAAEGAHAEHVCAFAREHAGERVVVIVPRLLAKLTHEDGSIDWAGTRIALPAGNYRNLLSGAKLDAHAPLSMVDLLAEFPVALLAAT
jgi:(1->4)-alpha-D-glucan 1-alpha-D-glucosylmutase